jgi:hypothetical protein
VIYRALIGLFNGCGGGGQRRAHPDIKVYVRIHTVRSVMRLCDLQEDAHCDLFCDLLCVNKVCEILYRFIEI